MENINKKESGVSIHITSLPSKYGIGTLGKEAYKMVDFLKESGFSYWDILPLLDVGYSNSPFQIISPFGYNPLLIDIDLLIEDELLTPRDLQGLDFGSNPRKVDYDKVILSREFLFNKAFKRFDVNNEEFIEFKNNLYLENYCIFKAIKKRNDMKAWFDYRLEDRYYDNEVKEHYLKNYLKEIDYQWFLQFIFKKQWNKLHDYARKNNIEIVGDVPHFVGFDSDAMYFNPELFLVDKRNICTHVAGYPSDIFNKRGQKWGYPLYDWNYMELNNYKWWILRLNDAFKMFDRIKLNHFRGFYEFFAIPFKSNNIKRGRFLNGPGIPFIEKIKELGPLIASGLGVYSEKFNKFLEETNLPSIRTLIPTLFDMVIKEDTIYPSTVPSNTYFYLGNHDSTPIKEKLENLDKVGLNEVVNIIKFECKSLNIEPLHEPYSLYDIAYKLIELILASRAEHVTFTFQDLMFKGKEARMNKPTTLTDNWTYRFLDFEFSKEFKNKLFELNKKYNRLNSKNY